MGLYGCTMSLYESIWSLYMSQYGCTMYMGLYGSVWVCMGLYGSVWWVYMSVYESSILLFVYIVTSSLTFLCLSIIVFLCGKDVLLLESIHLPFCSLRVMVCVISVISP